MNTDDSMPSGGLKLISKKLKKMLRATVKRILLNIKYITASFVRKNLHQTLMHSLLVQIFVRKNIDTNKDGYGGLLIVNI